MSQYYGLIKYWANYFYGKSSEQLKQTIGLDDLFQEGVVGALKAIDSFEPEKGCLTSWVTLKIRGHMLDAIKKEIRKIYNIPAQKLDNFKKLVKIEDQLLMQWGRSPSDTELAEFTGIPLQQVQQIRTYMEGRTCNADEARIADDTKDPGESSEAGLFRECFHTCVRTALTPNEGIVIMERLRGRTFKDIGQILGLSPAASKNIETGAIQKMKVCLQDMGWEQKDYSESILQYFPVKEVSDNE